MLVRRPDLKQAQKIILKRKDNKKAHPPAFYEINMTYCLEINDNVYCYDKKGKIHELRIVGIAAHSDAPISFAAVTENGAKVTFDSRAIGKFIFLTAEEAEKAIIKDTLLKEAR